MRLIDADALKAKIHDTPTEGTIADYCKRVMAECLDNDAPTIDAIPVGWIIDRANDPERAPLYRRYAQMLYEEWQKGQGTNHVEAD